MKAVKMTNITKKFGDLVANDHIDFSVNSGEIHSILGENGAGKTTLMKILFGLYARDEGEIFIKGTKVSITQPSEAIKLGIGMIHQHFMLVNRFTVAENIIAGSEPGEGFFIDNQQAVTAVKELSKSYGLRINPEAIVENISVGEQQRVEILKALYREADILILDEPTAVLTPQETEELFTIMEELKREGKTIIFITHKLRETMRIADRITILRDGKMVGTVKKDETNPTQLARMMVGRDVVLHVEKAKKEKGKEILEVEDLSLINSRSKLELSDISFCIKEGEILGVAGVEGNGQLELEEALMGLRETEKGKITYKGVEIQKLSVRQRRNMGIAHIPSDRLKRGLIADFNIPRNIILGSEWNLPFARNGILLSGSIREYSQQVIEDFDIRFSGKNSIAADLSGGNQQKLILGRELSRNPEFILAAQPTRGVDVGAIEYIHNRLLEMRDKGRAVLLISAELDELRSLSDRVIVLYEGNIVARGEMESFTEEELGLLMAGHKEGDNR